MYDPTVVITMVICGGMVVAAGSRPLECFWCGPLANQVHKSTRPPPCEGPGNHYMICEQQYTHCATVYSSPPHMESRVCTKTYSDECYTEFCNTTSTWKITCPCEGRMCNVRDIPRERELFDILNKLVDKTYKNYRFQRSITTTNSSGTPSERYARMHEWILARYLKSDVIDTQTDNGDDKDDGDDYIEDVKIEPEIDFFLTSTPMTTYKPEGRGPCMQQIVPSILEQLDKERYERLEKERLKDMEHKDDKHVLLSTESEQHPTMETTVALKEDNKGNILPLEDGGKGITVPMEEEKYQGRN